MPALAAVDLVAFAALFLLIGLLLATRYSFTKLGDLLASVHIPVINVHPFTGIAATIEHTVIHWCNVGIDALDEVAVTLWHWTTEALNEALEGLKTFGASVSKSLHWLETTRIPGLVGGVSAVIEAKALAALKLAGQLRADLLNEVKAREATVATMGRAVIAQARLEMAGLKATIEGEHLADFPNLAREVEHKITAAVDAIPAAVTGAADTLTGAAEQALEHAQAIAEADAAALREILGKLSPTDMAALIASIPVSIAAVKALEAESGLDNPECRQKVKAVCTTDPSHWLGLLAGLVALGVVVNLEELAKLAEEAVRFAEPAVDELARLSVAAAGG